MNTDVSAGSFSVISATKSDKIVVLSDREHQVATAKDGYSFLIVKMKPVKSGSTEDLRIIGGDKDGYPAIGVRWNLMSEFSGSGTNDPPFEYGHMKIDKPMEMLVIDVAFALPSSEMHKTMKMKTRADGGIINVSLKDDN